MILLFGIRVRFKVLRAVRFACPRCHRDRDGHVVEARRWFTLFFLPVIPLKRLGELVRCSSCGGQFSVQVLEAPTAADAARNLVHATRVAAIGMLRASGNDEAGRDAAVKLLVRLIPGYDLAALDADLAGIGASELSGWLEHLSDWLSPQGKETFFLDVASVAVADGPLTATEKALLETISKGLLMTAAQFTGLLVTLERPADRSPES